MQLIQAGGLSGDQPLPATMEKERTQTGARRKPEEAEARLPGDEYGSPSLRSFTRGFIFVLFFPFLREGRKSLTSASHTTPILSLLLGLGTTFQNRILIPSLLRGWGNSDRLFLAPSQQQFLFPGNPTAGKEGLSVALKSKQALPPTSQVTEETKYKERAL